MRGQARAWPSRGSLIGAGFGLIYVLVNVILLLVLGAPGPAAASAPDDDTARLDRFLEAALDATGTPGAAVAVTRHGQAGEVRGFGPGGDGRPVGIDTRFLVGSLSKSFTAVAVLQLHDAGLVDLDAAVRAYLPDFTTADPATASRITVRHLLNQTSGLADAGFPRLTGPVASLAERVRSLRDAHPVSDPGREYHYFEPNYQVLARLVEVVTGAPFSDYLREHIFVPLGMRDTLSVGTGAEANAVPGLAQGHVLVFGVPVARPELDGLLAGSGGVVTTARDMQRWLVVHTTGTGPDGRRLLTPADLALLHVPPPGVPGGYAMGWQVVEPPAGGPKRIEHTGVLSTFSAVQVLLPDTGNGFVVLRNVNSALTDDAGVTAGLAALLSGQVPDGVRSTATTGLVIAGLTLAIAALRSFQVVRTMHRPRCRGRWRLAAGATWLLLPAGVLVAVPWLILALIGRRFTWWQLALAMPDVFIFLAVAAAGGAALTAARLRGASCAAGPQPGGHAPHHDHRIGLRD